MKRRYRLRWSDRAIATGQTLDDEQREQVRQMAEMLREDPYRGYFFGRDDDGYTVWFITFTRAQLMYYPPHGNEVFVVDIGTWPWRELLGRQDED